MPDGRKNNGAKKGVHQGQGRKPKADEIAKIELMDSVGAPVEAWRALWGKVEEGDTQAIKCWIEHRYGRPKEQKDITTNGNDVIIPNIEFIE